MKNKDGFTLLELMVTIAIIAIISAITIPSMFGWISDRRIRGAVDEMGAVIKLTRQRAIRENQDVVILLDTANNKYDIFIDNGDGGATAGDHARTGSEPLLETIILPAGVNMYQIDGFAGGWFGYTRQGLPIDNREGEIHLKNSSGRTMSLRMDITGNPTIIE